MTACLHLPGKYTEKELRVPDKTRMLLGQGTNNSKPSCQRSLKSNSSNSVPAGLSPLQAATPTAAQTSSQLHTPPPPLFITYPSPLSSTNPANSGSGATVPIYPARTQEGSTTARTHPAAWIRAGTDHAHVAEGPPQQSRQSQVRQTGLDYTMLHVHQLGVKYGSVQSSLT